MFLMPSVVEHMKTFPYAWQRILYKLHWARKMKIVYRPGMEPGYIPAESLNGPECGGTEATRRIREMEEKRNVKIPVKDFDVDLITEKDGIFQKDTIRKFGYRLETELTSHDWLQIKEEGSVWLYENETHNQEETQKAGSERLIFE